MAKKKTYGVRGVMEWVAQIKAGKATINVHFSGGYPTTNGHTPAEFTTDNEVVQAAIERSEYFRKGRIVQLRPRPTAHGVLPESTVDNPTAPTAPHANDAIDGREPDGRAEETEVTISGLADAVSYLKANHGVSATKVKSLEAAVAIGASMGVKFVMAE